MAGTAKRTSCRSLAHQPAIIPDIYDAALDPEGLEGLAAIVMAVGDGSSAAVSILCGHTFDEVATHNLPDKVRQAYTAYYHRLNPCLPIAMARCPTRISRFTDILPEPVLERTEFYTDFMCVHDTVRVMGAPGIPIGPNQILQLGVHRARRSSNFSDDDVARLQGVLPHLQRAMQLRQRLACGLHGTIGLAALESLAFGCVICDGAGRVLFANGAAEILEASGALSLALRQGIGVPSPVESRQLLTLINETAAGGSGGNMILTAADGARVFALATPLPIRLGGQSGRVFITFRSENACTTLDAAVLQQLFPLTAAEARLALAVAAGHSLAEFGAEHRVSDNTLRTQIASVLRKTGAGNQRELVHLLGMLPPVKRLSASTNEGGR